MINRMCVAGTAALLLVCGALTAHAQSGGPLASPAVTASIRDAVARIRAGAARDPQESAVIATVADIIVTANLQPMQALASVRLAIAEEGCVFETDTWNRWGGAGLASVAASIQQAIGSGPAATIGEGGIAAAPPPPAPGGGGADYRSPIGG